MKPASLVPAAAIGCVTTLSGFAGLAYEVVWTRLLSAALGTEMLAAAGVVAGFFAGLAAGALTLDGLLRRTRRPRVAYALLEATIAGWALASVWLLPAFGGWVPRLLGTDPPGPLHWLVAFGTPAVVLLPATAAMGGTLVVLERMTGALRGPRVAALVFGVNTAGALVGALASVFVLLPAFGLSGTLVVLAATNLVCAAGAMLTPAHVGGPGLPSAPAARVPRLRLLLAATGCLGVAYEVVVIRLAAQILQDTIFSFATLLAAYLLGTACGALGWQCASRRLRLRPDARTAWLLVLLALLGLLSAAILPVVARLADGAAFAGPAGEFGIAAALLVLPAAGMGALFGHLAQWVRDARGSLGWAVGINSLGAAAGPAVASAVLIPAIGSARALIPLSLAYLALIPRSAGRRSLVLASLPALAGALLWLGPALALVQVPPGGRLVAAAEGAMAAASVVEDAAGTRFLDINGHFRMGGTSSLRSDWREAHIPLLLHPAPRQVLLLGVGTGATLLGAARLPGVQAEAVELSPEVVGLLPWFAAPGEGGAAAAIHIADARRFVLASSRQFDVVMADLFHPALDGSGALYTSEHFQAVQRRLAPGGVFCQWLPLFQLDLPSLQAIIRSFLQVFPDGTAWLAHYSVGTPMLALVGREDGLRIDPAGLAARMADGPMQAALERSGLQTPMDLFGLFMAGPSALARFAGAGPSNTDDRPFVALDAQRNVRALSAHPGQTLRAVLRGLHPDPGALLGPGLPGDDRVRLRAYWDARDRFIQAGLALPGDLDGRALIDAAAPGLLDAVRLSAEFDPAYEPLLLMARALLAVDADAGRALLRRIDAAAPSRPDARDLLRTLPHQARATP